jgi:hypothetical protein
MEILTTRTLHYSDNNGDEKELVLTIFVPVEEGPLSWKCDFAFEPPLWRQLPSGDGVDFLQAFVSCLQIARAYLEASKLGGRVHWEGMADCGLPGRDGRLPLPKLPVLTTRKLSYPDDKGGERELLLTVFVPFKEDGEDGLWKCGFILGPPLNTPASYGFGKDYAEALLDCLAIVRSVHDGIEPKSQVHSGDLHTCSDFPYTKGRSYRMGPRDEPPDEGT